MRSVSGSDLPHKFALDVCDEHWKCGMQFMRFLWLGNYKATYLSNYISTAILDSSGVFVQCV